MFRSRTLLTCILATVGAAAICVHPAMAQTTYSETEPNDSKATGNLVTLSVANDKLTGACSSTDTDYWHIKMAPLAAGLYRNVLTVTPTPTSPIGFVHKIWGLNQSAGVIGSTDTAVFTSDVMSGTNLARSVSWVGFGKQEELNYSIVGNASMTNSTSYTVTYARAAINPIDMTATSLYAGPITCRVRSVSGNANADCWLYDSNFNPLSNDATGPAGARTSLVAGSPTGTMDSFTRTLPAGTYYLAIGGASIAPDPQGSSYANLANVQPSVAADTTGAGLPVLELPNALVCGVSLGAAATFFADFTDSASPSAHTVTSTNIALAVNWGGNVNFVKINVIQPFLPSGLLSSNPSPAIPGSSTLLAVSATPGSGGASADITSVTADISALTSTPPTTINLTSSDGGVTWTGNAPVDIGITEGNKTIPFTIVEGGSVPGTLNSSGTVTVGPINDLCSGAIAVTVGTSSNPIDNQYAGTNDGPNACAAGGKGIWYTVTPAASGAYQIDTCGSGGNTLLTVYQIGDCADTTTWTQLGCNDDNTGGVCSQPQTSAVQDIALIAGTTYYMRVQSMNNSGTFVTGNVVVNVNQTGTAGACCDNTTNACTFTAFDKCPGTTSSYQGDGTSCNPLPCMLSIAGSCCNNSTGVCTPSTGSCDSSSTFNGSLSCSPTPCLVSGTCCDTTSGACSTIYGGVCASSAVAGSGTACDSFACVAVGTCCNLSTGGCTPLFSGSCGFNTTANASLSCSPTPCAAAGICCSSSGVCTVNFGATCTGILNSAVSVCGTGGAPNSACPSLGICCLFASGTCTVTYSGGCVLNAAFHTDTTCGNAATPAQNCIPYATATCCSSNGTCSVIYGGSCAGRQSTDTSCSPTTCPAIGTCCNTTTGSCTLLFSGSCIGTSTGAGTACGSNACAAYGGACCVGTSCSFLDQTTCGGIGGSWISGGTCTPNSCAGGVCCRGSTCSTAFPDAASCAAALDTVSHSAQAKFVPASPICNTPGSNTGPCCYANYNHNATIEVQDIFDFLSDWFAGKKGAIVGGDGATGTPQVQHIFSFLSAWFAGGCT